MSSLVFVSVHTTYLHSNIVTSQFSVVTHPLTHCLHPCRKSNLSAMNSFCHLSLRHSTGYDPQYKPGQCRVSQSLYSQVCDISWIVLCPRLQSIPYMIQVKYNIFYLDRLLLYQLCQQLVLATWDGIPHYIN